jgi:hypothetical protein
MAGRLTTIRSFVVQHSAAVTLAVGGTAVVAVVGANVASVPVPPSESPSIPPGSAPLLDPDDNGVGAQADEVAGERIRCIPKSQYERKPKRCR